MFLDRIVLLVVIIGAFFALPVNSLSFNLTDSISIGSPFYIQTQVENATHKTICSLASYDSFGNVKQVWEFDDDWKRLRTDRDGYLYSTVTLDDKYLIGKNYTFTMSCQNQTASKIVFLDVPGNMQSNVMLQNAGSYFFTHPIEVMSGVFVLLFAFGGVVATYKEIKK